MKRYPDHFVVYEPPEMRQPPVSKAVRITLALAFIVGVLGLLVIAGLTDRQAGHGPTFHDPIVGDEVSEKG